MTVTDLMKDLVATYRKHGWQLRRLLLRPESRAEIAGTQDTPFESVEVTEAPIDALWFSRVSHNNREAWELRLLAETQYALFETFAAEQSEEQRDAVRQEMEARLLDYVDRA